MNITLQWVLCNDRRRANRRESPRIAMDTGFARYIIFSYIYRVKQAITVNSSKQRHNLLKHER